MTTVKPPQTPPLGFVTFVTRKFFLRLPFFDKPKKKINKLDGKINIGAQSQISTFRSQLSPVHFGKLWVVGQTVLRSNDQSEASVDMVHIGLGMQSAVTLS